ncbi:iron-siderophore ABC transporter substrate-binding protein [Yoonia sp. BS5-3]|uniref:Iron-siderophore ABC transporter substrate-binding protein n=1 Tax=Yoonia phaeophyticola TaxID=3137369 RepID=A0ABZ2V719_9RHOB
MRIGLVSAFMILFCSASAALADARQIDHAYGTTEISGTPQRVVSLSYIGHDFLLALGTRPIALRYWYGTGEFGVWPWAEEALGDAEPVLLYGGIDIEQIALLSPDLIVGQWSGMTEAEYRLLSQIAPTVPHPAGASAFSASWQDMTAQLGIALDKEDQASEVIAALEARFERVQSAFPEWHDKTAVMVLPSRVSAFGSSDLRGRFLKDIGLQLPPAVDAMAGFDPNFIRIPDEAIAAIDTDVLIWAHSPNLNAALSAIPLRSSMRAVREGREVFADYDLTAALNHSSPLSLPYALDRLVPLIDAAIDGDLSTQVPGWAEAMAGPTQ